MKIKRGIEKKTVLEYKLFGCLLHSIPRIEIRGKKTNCETPRIKIRGFKLCGNTLGGRVLILFLKAPIFRSGLICEKVTVGVKWVVYP